MPRNGSGVYSLPTGTSDFVPNTPIESSKIDALTADLEQDANDARPIGAGGTGSTTAGGAAKSLGVLPRADYAGSLTVGGTADAVEITSSWSPTSYDNTIRLNFVPSGNNTVTNPTLKIDALAATTIKKGAIGSATALVAGDIVAGIPADVQYSSSDSAFILNNPQTYANSLLPSSNDGAALGSGSKSWSDLFLALGAVLNFNNGDVTVTHSANELTFSDGTNTIDFFGYFTRTWSNPTRALGTSYQNTNNYPIQVAISVEPTGNSTGGGTFQVSSDNSNWTTVFTGRENGGRDHITADVPAGYYYRSDISSVANLLGWAELS